MHLELGFILKERWLKCCLGVLLAVFILVRETEADSAVVDVEQNLIKSPTRAVSGQGIIKMCPPGGEVFR